MGFPPGVAEELVVKVLRSCDPKNWKPPNGATKSTDINNEIMCSTVAQEVEVIADEMENIDIDPVKTEETIEDHNEVQESVSLDNPLPTSAGISTEVLPSSSHDVDMPKTDPANGIIPPIIPTQKNSETYNGAERGNYSWSQTITELGMEIFMF